MFIIVINWAQLLSIFHTVKCEYCGMKVVRMLLLALRFLNSTLIQSNDVDIYK